MHFRWLPMCLVECCPQFLSPNNSANSPRISYKTLFSFFSSPPLLLLSLPRWVELSREQKPEHVLPNYYTHRSFPMTFLPRHFLSLNSQAEHMIDCTKITHFASLPTRIFVRHVLLGHSFLHRKRYVITSKWCGVIKMWIKEAKYFFLVDCCSYMSTKRGWG